MMFRLLWFPLVADSPFASTLPDTDTCMVDAKFCKNMFDISAKYI